MLNLNFGYLFEIYMMRLSFLLSYRLIMSRTPFVLILASLISLSYQQGPIFGAQTNYDTGHYCVRSCENTNRMVCRYVFTIEKYLTQSVACRNCSNGVMNDCYAKDCIAADGVRRPVTVINRMLPGPSIEVCVGDTVQVDLINEMGSEVATIHWHGIHQIGTNHMDGTFGVTQCPVPPKSSFRYRFLVDKPGTYFWHGHTGPERGDGAFGKLIVRQKNDPMKRLYDVDQHTIVISDWDRQDLGSKEQFLLHSDILFYSPVENILINGRGRYWPNNNGFNTTTTPVAVFKVRKNLRYRFRIIGATAQDCPVILSINGHTMTVINSDVQDLSPTTVDSIMILNGERYDVVVNAGQSVGNFMIYVRGEVNCAQRQVHQVAVLSYEGSDSTTISGTVGYAQSDRPGRIFNPFNTNLNGKSAIRLTDVNGSRPANDQNDPLYSAYYNTKLIFEVGFNPVNSYHQHRPGYLNNEVPDNLSHFPPQVSKISMKLTSNPIIFNALNEDYDENGSDWCNADELIRNGVNCSAQFCECKHILSIPQGRVVEIILIDAGGFNATHPFHLHGHGFSVVGFGSGPQGFNMEQFQNLDRRGRIPRKLRSPVFKDTVGVPSPGYTIIRVYFNNPGYWIFHCHIDSHLTQGMGMVFKVGSDHQIIPNIPKGFPFCPDFMPLFD